METIRVIYLSSKTTLPMNHNILRYTRTMQSTEENAVFHYALTGDIEGLQKHLENECLSGNEEPPEDLFWEKDEMGRNALFIACMLGRSTTVRELLKHGAHVNECTARGYSPLHCAALWGQLETVKTLVELGADMQAKNFRRERAMEVASRYSKMDCAEYLTWAEAKQDLQSYITHVRDTIADPEKVQGKLNKEDKIICTNTCSVKSDWIQNAKNPSIQDFIEQRRHLEDIIIPILSKLTTQPDVTAKASKN
ncbi:ankyrin repeat domain-containing protein 45 [Salmo salar]|uniref:Ankyrin repeat domain-containing protein 45 n=1 Tax=Salmo salar TaxID=8030 RepID=A0A1S3R2N9_SALSA|nr:ankyrin repeat domain-containing protein 45 [Salmo salar]